MRVPKLRIAGMMVAGRKALERRGEAGRGMEMPRPPPPFKGRLTQADVAYQKLVQLSAAASAAASAE